jgi:hypothetical protein
MVGVCWWPSAGAVAVHDEQLRAVWAGAGANGHADVVQLAGEHAARLGLVKGVAGGERHAGVLAAVGAGGLVVATADPCAAGGPRVVGRERGEAVPDEPQGAVQRGVDRLGGVRHACTSGK